ASALVAGGPAAVGWARPGRLARGAGSPISRSAQAHGDRDREIPDMRDRHGEWSAEAENLAASLGASVKGDRWLARARAADLDLAPADATHTEAEHLRDGLFGRPTTGEMENVRAAIHLLPFRVHAIQKAAGVPL